MLSTLRYNRMVKYVLFGIQTIGIIAVIILIFIGISPPISEPGNDGSRNYIRLEHELDEATRLNRESMEQISYLGRELATREIIIADLRSNSESGFDNNLQSGDIIIEAGILTDDSIQLLNELRRRFATRK